MPRAIALKLRMPMKMPALPLLLLLLAAPPPALLLWAGCSGRSSEPLKSLAPEPLPALSGSPPGGAPAKEAAREDLYKVAPAPVYGRKVPKDALRLELDGARVRVGGRALEPEKAADAAALRERVGQARAVLLVPDEETWLAQVAALLALLDDAGAEVWLLHPSGAFAYRLTLRDEPAFQAWLAEPKPGKIRIIQREDGYELSTNIGKLPGADPNGPSVPTRGGQLDIATLRHGLELLKGRFKNAEDGCTVPSFGTEVRKVAATLSAWFRAPEEAIFEEQCLVYPRPRGRDGG